MDCIKEELKKIDTFLFNAKCDALLKVCNNSDGSGLNSGHLIDLLMGEEEVCTPCYEGEADFIIGGVKTSFKKISGKSTIALNWSKNPKKSDKKLFTCPILILVLSTGKWWKRKLNYTNIIEKGFYIIDPNCKEWVVLSSNNKSNTIIKSEYLYKMISISKEQDLFIPLPKSHDKYKLTWSITSGFRI